MQNGEKLKWKYNSFIHKLRRKQEMSEKTAKSG